MGAYCILEISNFPIAATKNEIDPFILSLFQQEDQNSYQRRIGDRNKMLYNQEEDDDEIETVVEYSSSAKEVRDRLEVMGFTMKKVKADFELSKQEGIKRLQEYLQKDSFKSAKANLKMELGLLEKNSFEDFLNASETIIRKKYKFKSWGHEAVKTKDPLINYLLAGYYFDKFPFLYDLRILLRALLELTDDKAKITYDVTELIQVGDEYDELDHVYEDTVANITYNYELGEKCLILTEGSTDIIILQAALHILYPHLTGYFSFMDFGTSNASGSSSSLIASVKSFVGAGIKNRVVAIFDNDTAAESALLGLKKTVMPPNIRVLKYPDIDLAKKYPTIGPSGISHMNINGLACSIEIYLGEDVLLEKGELTPIQWKGYDQTLGKYQGEILNKSEIQKKFQKKAEICLKDPKKISNYDWTGLDSILRSILFAFNER
jgi:hypothetical protein